MPEEGRAAAGHVFVDERLLARALTHRSFEVEVPGGTSNERLEFLGDAVLGLVIADELLRSWDLSEGEMAKVRAAVVNEASLASVALRLGIGSRLRLGREDLRLYRRVADRLEGLVHPPQWVIHLDAPEPALLERIARRGRDHERVMTAEFLAGMRQAYAEMVGAMARSGSPGVLRVDCDRCDVRDAGFRAELAATIRQGRRA